MTKTRPLCNRASEVWQNQEDCPNHKMTEYLPNLANMSDCCFFTNYTISFPSFFYFLDEWLKYLITEFVKCSDELENWAPRCQRSQSKQQWTKMNAKVKPVITYCDCISKSLNLVKAQTPPVPLPPWNGMTGWGSSHGWGGPKQKTPADLWNWGWGWEKYWVLTQRGEVSREGDLQVETPELGMQQCIRAWLAREGWVVDCNSLQRLQCIEWEHQVWCGEGRFPCEACQVKPL